MPVCVEGSMLQACDGVPGGGRGGEGWDTGRVRWRSTEFLMLLCHRGHQVCPALSDLKENLDPWGPLDR